MRRARTASTIWRVMSMSAEEGGVTYANAAEAYGTAAKLSALLGPEPNTLPDPIRARRLAIKGLKFAIGIYRTENMTVKAAAAQRRLLEFEGQVAS
jgi:hypothetical protein